jgi:CzcA family heavy metal efflux pump
MVARLLGFVLRHRGLTIMLALVLTGAGIQAWLNLPIDAFPEISPIQAKIILKSPGMTPEEIEQRVVRPIELELLSIPNKRVVRSISKYGITDITVEFTEGVNLYWARQQVAERLAGILPELPHGVTGGLAPITTPLSDMVMFTLDGDAFSLAEKRRVLDWIIRPALRTLPNVAEVNSLGGEVQSFEVIPNVPRMAALGVSLADLRQSLMKNNANDGAGRIEAGEEALVVRVEGAIQSLDDIRRIRLATSSNQTHVFLDDVATVRMGALSRLGAVTQDGRGETVQGIVIARRGANARAMVAETTQRLTELEPRLPAGMKINVFYNRADLVARATGTVLNALMEAAVLVAVILVLFLGGFRAALVVAISLPLALLITFLMMQYFGLTANLMSLGGLAIALGMLVDASIVVVENIEAEMGKTEMGKTESVRTQSDNTSDADIAQGAVMAAVGQVFKPVASGILIICIVFLPLLTLEDLEGKLFAPVAITIVMALLASLVIAFTVVPALASILLRGADEEPRLMRLIASGYRWMRTRLWKFPGTLLGVCGLLLMGALWVYQGIGKTFMPTLDEGDILVQVYKLPSISLDASTAMDTRLQQAILAQVPEVRSIVARVGSDEIGLDPMGLNETDTYLVLKPRADWQGSKEDIIERLRGVFEAFPGIVIAFTQPIEMRVSEMLTGSRGDVVIKVYGEDLANLRETAQLIAQQVQKVPGATEVIAPKPEGLQYLSVVINRSVAGEAGFDIETLQQSFKNLIEGEALGIVLRNGIRHPLTLKGADSIRHSPEGFKSLRLVAPDGRSWAVGTLASVRLQDGPMQIDHEQGARLIKVQASVEGRDLTGFVADAQQAVKALPLAKEIEIQWGGQFENQQRAAARLGLVIPAAMIMIFIILTLSFGSVIQAGIIFLNIPFALVGGVFALALSGEYLSVPASVGFIALLGIAVLNGVVMVTHFNERLASGEALEAAVLNGSERRLRPVLMTAMITGLGMIPLLFASGPGSEIQRPLAVVVTGGILTSTLLTLLVLPILFKRFGAAKSFSDLFKS